MTKGQILGALSLLVCVAQGGGGANPLPQSSERALERLISQANGTPPEFAADVLLIVAQAGLSSKPWSRHISTEAFSLAANAQESVALKRIDTGGPISDSLNSIFSKGIDRISLQARAARVVLSDDKDEARDLFEKIDVSFDSVYSCEDQLYPDLSLYYSTMKAISETISDQQQLRQFFGRHVSRLHSASQLSRFVDIVASSRLEKHFRELVAIEIVSRLDSVEINSHIFAAEAPAVVNALVKLAGTTDAHVRDEIALHARNWIIHNTRHGICSVRSTQSIQTDGSTRTSIPPTPWDYFNKSVARSGLFKAGTTIGARELGAYPIGPPPAKEPHSEDWLTFYRVQTLMSRHGSAAQADRRWQDEMDRYLKELLAWEDGGHNSTATATFYLEKADCLSNALTLFPAGPFGSQHELKNAHRETEPPQPELAFRALTDLLDSSTATVVYLHRRALWFAPVQSALASLQQGDFIEIFSRARSPILRLYAAMAKLLYATDYPYY